MTMIKDQFNRVHDYLRISLTDNCNLRCFYCMPEEDYDFTPAARLMQAAEIDQLSRLFVEQGVKKIRLTGGEPLVRKDAARIIEAMGSLPVELVMTTNGTRVHEFLTVLKSANIKTINISLDTLQPDKFLLTTRRNLFHLVRSNIEVLLQHGFRVKINAVLMKGFNEEEINDFIAWTTYIPVQVRFIEFMPFSGNRWTNNQVFPLEDILMTIGRQYECLPVLGEANDTAKQFMIPGHAGSFAIISTMSAPFCSSCNRMRLTADGKLKSCLFSAGETDLLSALRNGHDVVPLIHQNIQAKAKQLGGQFSGTFDLLDAATIQNRSMITIGG
jgi:GTP 3',8-cyclase